MLDELATDSSWRAKQVIMSRYQNEYTLASDASSQHVGTKMAKTQSTCSQQHSASQNHGEWTNTGIR
jgi:hypothetical protein